MDRFLKEYDGHRMDDWGCVCSDNFKSFARKFRNYLKRTLPDCEIVNFYRGHYDVSGFLKKDGKYLYFSYDVPRGYPINVKEPSWMHHVLLRRAENEKDYTGKSNHFASLADFPKEAEFLLDFGRDSETLAFMARKKEVQA